MRPKTPCRFLRLAASPAAPTGRGETARTENGGPWLPMTASSALSVAPTGHLATDIRRMRIKGYRRARAERGEGPAPRKVYDRPKATGHASEDDVPCHALHTTTLSVKRWRLRSRVAGLGPRRAAGLGEFGQPDRPEAGVGHTGSHGTAGPRIIKNAPCLPWSGVPNVAFSSKPIQGFSDLRGRGPSGKALSSSDRSNQTS